MTVDIKLREIYYVVTIFISIKRLIKNFNVR